MIGRIINGRQVWRRVSSRLCTRPFSAGTSSNSNNSKGSGGNNGDSSTSSSSSSKELDAYRELEKLDFMTASKILFTDPPKKKKFGLDFHLVQLFFVCLPSLAVYLVAQYARYEMRRMEAELEVKKKAEEEKKTKELELKAAEDKESGPDTELQEVKARLGKLEEAIKEIVVDGSKKQEGSTISQKQKQEDGNGKKQSTATVSEASNSAAKEETSKGRKTDLAQQEKSGSAPETDGSQQNRKPIQD